MDKCTVKQVKWPRPEGEDESVDVQNLNTACVSLFPWFLLSAEELWIVHSDQYFQRLWCIYELSTWLTINGPRNIRFSALSVDTLLRKKLLPFLGYMMLAYLGMAILALCLGPG